MVSPFAAGGNTDTLGRYIAPRLHERLGQPVIMAIMLMVMVMTQNRQSL